MRPTADFALHATLAAVLTAFATTSAAAGPAFIKLGSIEGETVRKSTRDEWVKIDGQLMPTAAKDEKWIEIESFHWGVTQQAAPFGYGGGGSTGKVQFNPLLPDPSGAASRNITMKGRKIGENSARGTGANEMSMDDTAGKEKAGKLPGKRTPPTVTLKRGKTSATDGDPDRPIIAGNVPNASAASPGANETLTVGGGRTETASGQATGKRQHMPIRARAYYDQPLATGSVWVRVASPWTACRVGARYPSIELGDGAARYVLQDVTVASCGGSRDADDRPTEEVAFYYNKIAFNYASSPAKVQVRGWDPKKKEE